MSLPLALMGIRGRFGPAGGSNGSRARTKSIKVMVDESQAISNSSMTEKLEANEGTGRGDAG